MIMPLSLFIVLIVIATIAGSLIGSAAGVVWIMHVLNNPKGKRRNRRAAASRKKVKAQG